MATTTQEPAELAERAKRLREAARGHFKSARRHRLRAKALMAQFDEVAEAAARLGINVRLNQPSTESKEDRVGTEDPTQDR